VPEPRYDALTLPAFRSYQFARILMVLAQQIMGVAVSWQVYALTGKALDLGLVGLAQFAPTFLLWPLIGTVIDRVERRDLLVLCWGAIGVATCGLAWFDYSGSQELRFLLACNFAIGLARAFSSPTGQSLLAVIAPGPWFANAVTWSSTVFQLGSIAGPAVGGVIFAMLGAAWKVHAVAATCAAFACLAMLSVPRSGPATTAQNRGNPLDGLRFVFARPELFAAIALDLVAVLFGGVVALLPIYASDILGGGPDALGLLRAAPAAGAAAAALWLAKYPIQRRAGWLMLGSVVVFGVATGVFAVSRNLALSLGALAVSGAADELSVVVRHCIVQLRTPNEMRGRVSTVNWLFVSVSNELGQFQSGVAAAWLGVVPAAVLGGVVAVLSAGVAAVFAPKLRQVDKLE
jgi:MFS family permease